MNQKGKWGKYISSWLFCMMMVLAIVNMPMFTKLAQATEYTVPGTEIVWEYTEETKTLYVKGKGDIPDYESGNKVPWAGALPYTEKIVIGNDITRIGDNAFEQSNHNQFTLLKTVEIGSSVKEIGEYAFQYNFKLESVKMGASVTDIEKDAFYADLSLKTIDWNGALVKNIGAYAFNNDLALTSISLPNSVEYIGDGAFGLTGLKSFTYPRCLKAMGDDVFKDCDDLTKIIVPDDCFYFSSDGEALYDREKTILYRVYSDTGKESYTMPDTVVEIKSGAFDGCSNIHKVTLSKNLKELKVNSLATKYLYELRIPANVETIDDLFWRGNFNNVEKFIVDEKNPNFSSIDGDVYSKDGITLYRYAAGKFRSEFNIPATVKYINANAFSYTTRLKSVGIPMNLRRIGECAFLDCNNLSKLVYMGPSSAWGTVLIEELGNQVVETCFIVYHDSHVYSKKLVKATKEKDGYYSETCICGETKISKIIPAACDIKLSNLEFIYDGKDYFPSVKVKDKDGNVIDKFNYTVTFPEKAVDPGVYQVKIEFEYEYEGTEILTYRIKSAGNLHACVFKPEVTKATTSKNGKKETKCTICNKTTKTETIYAAKTIKLSATKYTYDGKAKKPTVIVKDSKGKAIATSNYTVTYQSGRKKVGVYTVTVTFKGDYSGTKQLTFKINPPKTKLNSVKAGKKAFTAKWAKKTKEVTGYQIQYSTSKTFAKKASKTVKVTSAKTISNKISKLTGKKKYYVRIRTYKTVGKKTYYSDWSAKKTVTTKK